MTVEFMLGHPWGWGAIECRPFADDERCGDCGHVPVPDVDDPEHALIFVDDTVRCAGCARSRVIGSLEAAHDDSPQLSFGGANA